MFETNTASCGGFAGISDTYGAALWGIDYGMQLAYGNFTHGLLHTGGQNAFYNVSVLFFFLGRYIHPPIFFSVVCSHLPVSINQSFSKSPNPS
jgi:hypothetical protein